MRLVQGLERPCRSLTGEDIRIAGLTDAVLKLARANQSIRVIVEFPAGYTPPARGTTVTRDEARPYEITEVRKDSEGQLNVFVREIMQ